MVRNPSHLPGTTQRGGTGTSASHAVAPWPAPPAVRVVMLVAVLGLSLILAVPAAAEDGEAPTLRAVADQARPTVVTLTWHPLARPEAAQRRLAVVLEPGGPLVAAGPVHREQGRWLVTRADGAVAEVQVLGQDAETSLTVLSSPWPEHPPVAPPPPGDEPQPGLAALRGRAFVLLGADEALALGALRQRGRRLEVEADDSGRLRAGAELVEAAVAALPADLGGPWLDAQGRLLALQVAVPPEATPAPGERPAPVAALGLPAATARIVAPLLARHGRVPRAALGIWTRPTGEALRAQLGLAEGHLVVALVPEGAAERAGLRVHDVLRSFQGRPFEAGATLADVLLAHRPGERVRLEVLRKGEPQELTVTLGSRDR